MNPAHLHSTLRIVARLALAFALIGTAAAQTLTGALSGRVSNSASGQSLQGAIVRVVGTELRADTARDGSFDLRAVPAGRYEVEVSYFGLDTKRASVEIIAGRPASLNFLLGSDAVQLEAVKVEADVLGQARAINQQRVAESMKNVTSEELFGEMTDNNVAKALQRIPGISANSDGGTEVPRYVNIRGFDGSLNSVQLNGARLPTSGTGQGTVYGDTARAFALDDLPANAITTIEVIKAPTPDLDGDTVGGIVNLITKSAFDRGGRSIEFSAGADYVKLREKFVPNFTLGYSDVVQGGKLGVRVDLSYFKGDEGFDNIDYDSLPLVPQIGFKKYLNLPLPAPRSSPTRTRNTTTSSSSVTATASPPPSTTNITIPSRSTSVRFTRSKTAPRTTSVTIRSWTISTVAPRRLLPPVPPSAPATPAPSAKPSWPPPVAALTALQLDFEQGRGLGQRALRPQRPAMGLRPARYPPPRLPRRKRNRSSRDSYPRCRRFLHQSKLVQHHPGPAHDRRDGDDAQG